MKKETKMIWNVFNHNINKKEIEVFNVFSHSSFNQDIQKVLKKKITRNELNDELKSTAIYYFWAKAECEIVATSFPPYISNEELKKLNSKDNKYPVYCHSVNLDVGRKIDIYQQLNLNWDRFVDYVWEFAKK